MRGREPASARKGYEDALVLRIDVSKDRLDIMVLPNEQCFSVPNDEVGWATLLEVITIYEVDATGERRV